MKNINYSYASLGLGLALIYMAPKENLSPQEINAGVISWKGIGSALVIVGGSMILINYLKNK